MASGALLWIQADSCFRAYNQIILAPLSDDRHKWRIYVIFPKSNEESVDEFEISFRKLSKNKTSRRASYMIEFPPKPQPKFSLFSTNRIEIIEHNVTHHQFTVDNETFAYSAYELILEPDIMQYKFSPKNRKIFDVSLKTNRDDHFVHKLAAEFYIGEATFQARSYLGEIEYFESRMRYLRHENIFNQISLYSKMIEKKYSPQNEYLSRDLDSNSFDEFLDQAGRSNSNIERIIELLGEDPSFILYTLCFDTSYTDEEKQVTKDYLAKIDNITGLDLQRRWFIPFIGRTNHPDIQSLDIYPKLLLARTKAGYEAIFSVANRLLSCGCKMDEIIEASVLFYFKTKTLEIIPWK